MKVLMLRNLANRPDRLEGQVYDVDVDEANQLFAARIAERADDPTPPAKPPKPGKPGDPPART